MVATKSGERKVRRRDQRLIVLGAAGVLLALAAALTISGLQRSVVYFFAPSELAAKAEPGRTVRLGGLVVEGSIRRDPDGAVRFTVTDNVAETEVRYAGVLPDLFRDGQGVVAEGVYAPGAAFEASRVLAKHDETYMPREVAEALKARGEWKGPAN
jgi:cytochrome c-type biogenesis protein CcmE